MAKSLPQVNEAECVVVGAGRAGCAVAGRLADAGRSVVKQSGVGARHGDQGLLKYTNCQNVGVLKKQVIGPRPGQSYEAYAKQTRTSLKIMRRLGR